MSDTTGRPAEDSAHVDLLKAIYEAIDLKAVPSGEDADEIRMRLATVRGVIESITVAGCPAHDAAETLRMLIAEINGEYRAVSP